MTEEMGTRLEHGWRRPDGTYICDGCNVREPHEHRCHGDDGGVQCDCLECNPVIPHREVKPIPEMTVAEWRAEGIARFGSPKLFRFVCPRCDHVASVMDFEPYKDKGAKIDHAATTCIGRWNDDPEVGCDWAAFGLLGTLNGGVRIIHPDGKSQLVFDFAPRSLACQVSALARPSEAIGELEDDEQINATAQEIEGNMMYLGMDDAIIDLADRVGAMEKGYAEWRSLAKRLLVEIEKVVELAGESNHAVSLYLVPCLQSPDFEEPASVVPDQEGGTMRGSPPAAEGKEAADDPGDAASESS